MIRETDGRGGIGLADCATAIQEGRVLDDLRNPSRPHQRMFILDMDGYAFCVPYVIEEDGTLFLKTAYPSRKYTKQYLGE